MNDDIKWFNEEELKLIQENRKIDNTRISNDTSYIMSIEEEEKLFGKMVLGKTD